MVRQMVRLVVVLCALLFPALSAPPSRAAQIRVERKECIVYITRTGAKYHQEGCRYLRRSRIPITLSRARRAGYAPCLICGGSSCD